MTILAHDLDAAFWQMYILAHTHGDVTGSGDKVARINGRHYTIDKREPHTYAERNHAGHGGQEFRIRFISGPHNGQTVTTHNLWSQDKIPEEFRAQLPDNAVFVR